MKNCGYAPRRIYCTLLEWSQTRKHLLQRDIRPNRLHDIAFRLTAALCSIALTVALPDQQQSITSRALVASRNAARPREVL